VWYARERTLSIHSIVTRPRELFYWLAVLVTFALGTAVGDWTLQLTGWAPGVSVLLPAGLIVFIVIGWRLGANAVLSFWLAYILTRPLGANLGDWFASPSTSGGLGLGYGITSAIFLTAILATVVYLTRTRSDVIEEHEPTPTPTVTPRPVRERIMLGYYAVVAVATGVLMIWAAGKPHTTTASAAGAEEADPAPASAPLSPGQAVAHFPAAGARSRVKDLETAWDSDQATLQPMDGTAWNGLDGQIDSVLKAVRASKPDPATETQTLTALVTALQ
jgi:hypothetical protein